MSDKNTNPALDKLVESGHLKSYSITNGVDQVVSHFVRLIFPDGKSLTMSLAMPRYLPSWHISFEEELTIDVDESDFIE